MVKICNHTTQLRNYPNLKTKNNTKNNINSSTSVNMFVNTLRKILQKLYGSKINAEMCINPSQCHPKA